MRLLLMPLQLLLAAVVALGGVCEIGFALCILATPSLWSWPSLLMLVVLALQMWFLPQLLRALLRI